MKYSNNELIKMYEGLVLGRKYEEYVLDLVNQGKLQGFFHLGIGQEGAQVGVISALSEKDYFSPTHRSHPALVNKLDLKKLTAELLGRVEGYNKGKAFTFHISSKKDKVLPVCGMLGAGVPVSTGTAWALKQDKNNSVVVCVLGDGTISEGNVHEGMNIASLLKLPIVYVIENNGYAISQPASRQVNVENLSTIATAFGMEGVTVDGNDVIAVREAIEEALEKARNFEPSIVELKTYRWRAHFEGDPCLYRTQEEVEEAMKNCPIKKLEKTLLDSNIISEEQIKEIDEEIFNKIKEAFDYAMQLPLPTIEDTLDIDAVYSTKLGGELF